MELTRASRADIRLVILGGVARYADEDYARALAPPEFWSLVHVDGKPKMLARSLVAVLAAARSVEPGLEIPTLTWRAA
jgi:hypothetical protein